MFGKFRIIMSMFVMAGDIRWFSIWPYVFNIFLLYIRFFLVHTENADSEVVLVTSPYLYDDNLYFHVIEPEEIGYVYKIRPAVDFGITLNSTLVGVELVLFVPSDGCSPSQNDRFIRGNVALVERGMCSFLTKAINAELAGAVSVIITDNNIQNDDRLVDMAQDGTYRSTDISAFFLSGKDGYMIRTKLEELDMPNAIINIPINVTGRNVLPGQLPPWTLW